MRFGSVCSGIEAASVAWHPLGWRAAFLSEIEAFPRAVLAHHYPEVPLHGDFTTIKAGEYEPIDLLVGGTPCQSFSVAGLRGGLADDRGNLALEYLRLADRLRPRWLVWENVPGVLSSNGGRDFGSILGGLVELGYGFAYRVLDAQFFGVAQRRRRVFVVGHFGDWRRAAAVLFERHSLQGHPSPRREAGESAPTIPSRSSAGGGLGTDFDCDGGLIQAYGGNNQSGPIQVATAVNAHGGPHGRLDFESETFVAHTLKGEGFDASEDGTGRGTPLVPVTYSIMPQNSGKDYKARPVEVAQPLMAGGPVGGNQGGDFIVQPAIAFALRGREGGAMPEVGGDQVGALRAAGGGSSRDYVAFGITRDAIDRSGEGSGGTPGERSGLGVAEDIAQTIKAKGPGAVGYASAVRRLTPRECERLQGFPEVENTLRILVCRSEDEKRARARSVKSSSALLVPEQSEPVAVHVLIDLERQVLQLHSLGRSPSSASIAEAASLSRHPLPADAFARLAALTNAIVERAIRTGETAPRQSTTSSTPAASGSVFAPLCGSEIDGLASDAERFTAALSRCSRFITSEAGPDTPSFASILETSACCAAAAMTGFIPEAIRNACSYELRLTVHQGYTHIPWRKGVAPDGPRYKALGNSMAVPVMAWIGRRIQAVEAIGAQRIAA